MTQHMSQEDIRLTEGEDGLEGKVYSALFDQVVTLFAADADLVFARRCAVHLNQLSDEVVEHLCRSTVHYCDAFLSEVGEPLIEFAAPRDVLKLVTPQVLIVPCPEKQTPVVHLELECDWEPEHGLEWVVREDKVLYVGPFNDEDPWGSFTPKNVWNFA
ncbi:hypothetical protein HW452_11570 [Halomonas aquamarina]|uniref:Uncharacterized protein n=1 Tax=Vreelandella aquamarina TaxID=77097 RepID=A0ACC5VVR9_9GAMM|nr:hypothetical protein [Halomonas aquamarina]MBZ5488162.1 hypothetical protein [Halomonas aquamarina]